MSFNVSKFQAAHFRKPKGFGVWAFEVERRVERADGFVNEVEVVFAPCAMSFQDAKRWFRASVMDRSVSQVSGAP